MTENEARQVIECIGEKLNDNSLVFYTKVEQKALNMAIQALEERQQYRAIGTIEEFKALKEKSVAKKVVVKKSEAIELDICDEKGNVHLCPNCNDYIICSDVKHCWNCGQALET